MQTRRRQKTATRRRGRHQKTRRPVLVVVAVPPERWREMARRCLGTNGKVRVVAEVAEGDRAVAAVKAHRPTVVLLDREIPDQGALGVLPELRQAHWPTSVLAVSPVNDDAYALEVVKHGGQGLMAEEALPAYLPKAVHRLAAGEPWLTRTQEVEVLQALWQLAEPR